MKTFDEIYEELKNADNNELNNSWQEAKKENEKSKKITAIICLIIDIFVFILFFRKGTYEGFGFFLIYIIAGVLVTNIFVFVIINAIFSKKQNEFKNKYKNIVINKIMNNFYNNIEYFPNKPMPEDIYNEVDYDESYDIYTSEDYMKAKINNKYEMQMAEVITQVEERYKDSEGETQTRIITIFHGLFAKIVMHKSIKGEINIVQNGKLFSKDRLKMDSSEFEKYFDVKASDKIIGMQLLTADVMEELVEFQNKTNMEYDIFIKDSELYLRFHSGDMFEPGKLKNMALDKKTIQEYFYMLDFTYNLSNKLINLINDAQI